MSREAGLDPAAAAVILSNVTGMAFHHVGQLAGGETGAHQFIGPDGQPLVVKWETISDRRILRGEAVALSERLRLQAGWPVPAESVVDADEIRFVVIQEFMPGTPPTAIDHRLVDQLLDLHSRRLGLAEPYDPIRWPMNLITPPHSATLQTLRFARSEIACGRHSEERIRGGSSRWSTGTFIRVTSSSMPVAYRP